MVRVRHPGSGGLESNREETVIRTSQWKTEPNFLGLLYEVRGDGDAGEDGMKNFKELFDADGKYMTDNRYQEILRLDAMLTEKQIPHTCQKVMDGWQVIYPQDGKKRVMDAIEHFGSYGNEQDKLEIMGLLTPEEKKNDTVLGYLSAEEVFSRIDRHWKEAQP